MKRLALAALAAALLLVGCSDDDSPEPKIAPTDTSSASATPTPPAPTASGPVEPTMPAAAEGDDAAAAEAFVRHYWAMVNYAQATGDTEGLKDLGADSCAGCRGGWQGIDETYGAGGTIQGGEFQVTRLDVTEVTSHDGSAFAVEVSLTAAPQVIKEPGTRADKKDGGDYELNLIAVRRDGAWSIARWDVA